MGLPRATILIPLLRQNDRYLEQCLRSAIAQLGSPDILVVTSPRTPAANLDTVARLAHGRGNVRTVEREREGFAAALNTGIRRARAERIGFLLSDDWLQPDALEACLARDADIVATNMAVFAADGATRLDIRGNRTAAGFERLTSLHDKAAYIGHFLLFRRDILLAVGGVDESIGLTGPDDFDLPWTLLEHGATVALVEAELYNYRDHSGERLTLRPAADQIRDLERILDKHRVTGPEREQWIRRHARWYGKTLLEAFREIERSRASGPHPDPPPASPIASPGEGVAPPSPSSAE